MRFVSLVLALAVSLSALGVQWLCIAAPSTGRGVLVDGQPLSEELCIHFVRCTDEPQAAAAAAECERFEQHWSAQTHQLETARSRVTLQWSVARVLLETQCLAQFPELMLLGSEDYESEPPLLVRRNREAVLSPLRQSH